MKKILLIIAVFFALGSKTFANQESINKSGFISPDLKTISKLETLEDPKKKIIIIHNHGQNKFDGAQTQCISYGQLRNKASLVNQEIKGKKLLFITFVLTNLREICR